MKYTKDQEEALNKKLDWLNSPKDKDNLFYVLEGAAGTGKTTITNEVINQNRRLKIAVTAPTHKAKRVIAEVTKKPGETIQGLLGLRPNVDLQDFNPNRSQFDQRAEERIGQYDTIIIDESSMLNKASVNLIKKRAIVNNTRVLFMGDSYQLPPINENISDVFKLKQRSVLTTMVRQDSNNPNQSLLLTAREDIKYLRNKVNNTLTAIPQDIINNTGYKVLQKKDFFEELMQYYYDSEYKYNFDLMKTIAYTNRTASSINLYIRNKLIDTKRIVEVGDILMGHNTVSKEKVGHFGIFYRNVVENSMDYKVKEVKEVNEKFGGYSFEGYKVKFEDQVEEVFILAPNSYQEFVTIYNKKLEAGKKNKKWKAFYEFKNQILLLGDIYDTYGNFICKKDLDYGYCITTHKSQGSTYNNVAIAAYDFKRCHKPIDRKKLMYVGLSRTKNMNIIYNG